MKVVFGSDGTSKSAIRPDQAADRMDRTRQSEGPIAVSARAPKRRPVARRSDGNVGDAKTGPVNGHETIHITRQLGPEEMRDTAEVAQALLPHRPNERDRPGGLHLPAVERTCDTEHDGEPAAIVTDAWTVEHVAVPRHRHVGPFGKDSVQMGAEDEVGPRTPTGALAQHVADRIDADALQTERR